MFAYYYRRAWKTMSFHSFSQYKSNSSSAMDCYIQVFPFSSFFHMILVTRLMSRGVHGQYCHWSQFKNMNSQTGVCDPLCHMSQCFHYTFYWVLKGIFLFSITLFLLKYLGCSACLGALLEVHLSSIVTGTIAESGRDKNTSSLSRQMFSQTIFSSTLHDCLTFWLLIPQCPIKNRGREEEERERVEP